MAKLAAELYCVSFHRVYGIETVALRYFNVFGPRQDPKSQYAAVVPRFIDAIHRGHAVPIHGDGTQSRDFTYVANVVEANLLASERDGAGGTVLNIATGRQASVNELADAVGAVLGKPVEKEYLPGPHGRRARLVGRRRRGEAGARLRGRDQPRGRPPAHSGRVSRSVVALASRGASGTQRTRAS